ADNKTEACAQCLCAMGVAGERAYAKLQKMDGGSSTYRDLLIDEVYKMTDAVLVQEAKYEVR
ncbi:MAG: hydroxyethylthiazole kinase, partial [Clostridia bacterium]|nr:hydroxyethylthiazole kinase [Clostridia bacterium]